LEKVQSSQVNSEKSFSDKNHVSPTHAAIQLPAINFDVCLMESYSPLDGLPQNSVLSGAAAEQLGAINRINLACFLRLE
jgi:hypothetical protein